MIEIRIRVLLKSDLGMDVVPGTTLVAKKAPASFDVANLVEDLVADLSPALGKLRRMTSEEADAYFAKEEAEDAEGFTDLGLSDADLAAADGGGK